jgi:serine/threonine-protein kinase PRP4
MGEHFNERYKVESVLGKGVFSTVLRAIDTKFPAEQTKDKKPVYTAIKIIRNNDMMAKASAKELEMLKLLSKDGAADKHHIVQLSDDFVHHGHMCLVFEPMAMNLREVIKKFGHNRGINIEGVQVFSKQMFQALKHIRKCKIVHADIKPDNILINERHNAIKICDFGSGSYINECDITPYLVSRWYRAPEITLCLRYDYAIDLWSIGCCMYELYTGKVMFPGNSNNDMLRRFMEIMGRFPNKLIKRSMTKMIELGRPVDFTEDFKFMRIMIDKITKKETVKILTIDEKPVKDLLKLLMPTTLQPDQARKVKQLEQILRGALSLNPDNRFSIEQCLSHPFVKEPFGFQPKRREAPAPNSTA